MQLETLRQSLLATGARDCHVDRVLRAWTQGKPLDAGPRSQPAEHYLPLALRNALASQAAALVTRRERVDAWVALYRALGGGWEVPLPQEEKTIANNDAK